MTSIQSILYLDTSRKDAAVIHSSLKDLSFKAKFIHASTKEAFIQNLKSVDPAIILVAYRIKDYDGISAIKDAHHYHPFTPVIVVTGAVGEEAAVQCIKAGAADFILKTHLIRLTPIIENIIEQWKNRRQLRKSEEKYKSIFFGAKDGIIVVDRKGTLLEVNPAFENLTGLQSNELVGKSAYYLAKTLLSIKVLPRILPLINDGLLGIPVKPFELKYKDKLFEISIPRVANVFGLAAIFRDITTERRKEEHIRASEARYRDLVDNMYELICTHDLDGHIKMVNRATVKMLRYSESTILKKKIQDLIVPEFRDQYKNYINRIKKDGKVSGLLQVQDRYGKKYIWEYNNTLKTDGKEPLVRGISHDVTAAYKANQQLKFSEARYRDIVENSNDLIFTHDLNGNLTWVNKMVSRILGYPVSNFKSLNIKNLIQKQYADQWESYLDKIQHNHEAEGYARIIAKSGEERILEYRASLQSLPGREKQVRAIVRDVTERIKYEEELKVREAEFRTLYENATIGLYRTTPDGQILLANPSLLKMLGFKSFKELQNRNLEVEAFPKSYNRKEFRRIVEQEGGCRGYVSKWSRLDGKTIFVRENARAIRDSSGKILYYEGTVEDITELHRTQRKLQENLEELELLQQVNTAILNREPFEKVIRTLAQSFHSLVRIDLVNFYIFDRDKIKLINMAQIGNRPEMRSLIKKYMNVERKSFVPRLKKGSGFETAVRTGKGFVTENPKTITALFADFSFTESIQDKLPLIVKKSHTCAVGCIPIKIGNTCLGLVVFNSQRSIADWEFKRMERLVTLITNSLNYHQVEEEIRERDERYQSLLNTATNAIIGMNDHFEINIWNPAATAIFGYSAEEAIGKQLHNLIQPEGFQDQIQGQLERFARTGKGTLIGQTTEVTGVNKEGLPLPLELSISAYKYGEHWMATGIIHDIRGRKRQEQIRESLRRVSKRLTIRLSPKQVGPIVAEEIKVIFNYHVFGLFELDWEKEKAVGLYSEETPAGGHTPKPVKPRTIPFRNLSHKQILKGQSVLENLSKAPGSKTAISYTYTDQPSRSILWVSILWENKPIGFLTIQNQEQGAYTKSDIHILESLAGQIAGAFQRAQTEEMLLIQQTSIEQTPESIIVTDADGRIVYVNPGFTRITNYEFDEVRGKNPRIWQSGQHSKAFYKNLWDTIKSGHTWRGEFLNKRKGGELYWESASISPVKDHKGDIVRFVAVKEDITERKQAQEALTESEEKFRTLFEESIDAIYIRDDTGKLLDFNFAFMQLLGYNYEELIKMSMADLFIKKADWEKLVKTIRAKHYVDGFSTRLRKKSGEEIHAELTAIRRQSTQGYIIQGIIRDVTESVRRQEELEAAMIKAQVADRVKTLFLANMSHEIRTPLNSLLGFSEVVEYETKPMASKELNRVFDSIHQSGNRIINTIHEILDISTIEAGGFELHPQDIHLKTVVEQIVNELGTKAEKKGLYLNYETPLRNDLVYVDEYAIQHAVMNLVDNAIKYTIKGGVTVKMRNMNKNLILTISDTGIGMSKDYQQQMWNMFSQESTGYTKKYQGVGLGLALVKRYCSLNNVDIDVFSKKGVGSTFTLTFKRAQRAIRPNSKT